MWFWLFGVFFFSFFIMNVSARLDLLCFNAQISKYSESRGCKHVIKVTWAELFLSVQHTSALVTGVPRSYCAAVSHSCLLMLAQQKAEVTLKWWVTEPCSSWEI